MAGAVLVYFADATLERVDEIVAARKLAKAGGRFLSAKEQAEANRLARAKGKEAAERYVASLDLPRRGRRASRVGVLNELVELGLKHLKT